MEFGCMISGGNIFDYLPPTLLRTGSLLEIGPCPGIYRSFSKDLFGTELGIDDAFWCFASSHVLSLVPEKLS